MPRFWDCLVAGIVGPHWSVVLATEYRIQHIGIILSAAFAAVPKTKSAHLTTDSHPFPIPYQRKHQLLIDLSCLCGLAESIMADEAIPADKKREEMLKRIDWTPSDKTKALLSSLETAPSENRQEVIKSTVVDKWYIQCQPFLAVFNSK